MLFGRQPEMPTAQSALPGRDRAIEVSETHVVNGNRIVAPFPNGLERRTGLRIVPARRPAW